MLITTKIKLDYYGNVVEHEFYEYDGEVAKACGASGQQKQAYNDQHSLFGTITSAAQSVMGFTTSAFNKIVGAMAPIVAAGPNQHGWSQAQRTAVNTQITEGAAQTNQKLQQAAGESMAASGGGNTYIPQGAKEQLKEEGTQAVAANESNQKLQATEADYAQGTQNFWAASGALAGAPSMFQTPTGMFNSASGAGANEAETANQISQANMSPWNAVAGVIGQVAGAAGMAYGGKGKCWMAAAVFNEDFYTGAKTALVRNYLWNDFASHWYAKIPLYLYDRFGKRLSQNKFVVRLLTPLFKLALRKAEEK